MSPVLALIDKFVGSFIRFWLECDCECDCVSVCVEVGAEVVEVSMAFLFFPVVAAVVRGWRVIEVRVIVRYQYDDWLYAMLCYDIIL